MSGSGVSRKARGSYGVQGAYVAGYGSVVGKLEGAGPLGAAFGEVWNDDLAGQTSWEEAERELWLAAIHQATKRADWDPTDPDLVLGGDLLDQLYSTNFSAREHHIPLAGLFSACASFTQAVGLASLLVAAGGPEKVLAGAASHHLAAERQFRFPVELGYQRAPTASWTATAAGVLAIGGARGPIAVRGVTLGRVVDRGSKNPMDLGTAMAPAAHDTLERHLSAFNRSLSDYDRVVTGDLGVVGSSILGELMGAPDGFEQIHDDCGRSLYHASQDTHNGGSGAGCAAAVFSGPVIQRMLAGDFRRVLLVATGALFSPTSYQQGESIPGIAHAVEFVRAWDVEKGGGV